MARIASKTVTQDAVLFAFADGQEVQAQLDTLNPDIIRKLALHGLSQKVGDSYAGAESIAEARIMADAVIANLEAGLWAAKAQGGGGKLAEALHRATEQPLDDCSAKVIAMDDKGKKELRKHPAIKAALAEIEAENAERLMKAAGDSGADLGALFD